jgi:hypothetical protein
VRADCMKKGKSLSSKIVGTKFKQFYFRVTSRQIQNYTASIFDEHSLYGMFEAGKNIIAHPLFPVRISWKIIENIKKMWDIELPENFLDQLLHQSEYLEIKRLLKAGDELTIGGEIVALNPHKLGAEILLKFDFYDQYKELLLAEYVGAILLNISCTDRGKKITELPLVDRIEKKFPIWETKIVVSRAIPYIYDGCNGISHPIHTDPNFAKSMGLPDIILQGTATLAISLSAILKKEPNLNPEKIKIISAKFSDIVVPPNVLSVRLLKRSPLELYFAVTNEAGNMVIKGGYIQLTKF